MGDKDVVAGAAVVTCDDMFVLSGDAIDRSLPSSLREEFHQHISLCRSCCRSYELELATHQAIHQTVRMVSTPINVRRTVIEAVEADLTITELFSATLLSLLHGMTRPAVLAGGIAVAAFLYFFPQQPTAQHSGKPVRSAGIDILQVTSENLGRSRSGELRPNIVAANPDGMYSYFKNLGVTFPSRVPLPSGFDSYGAILTQHDGIQMAHIICRTGGDVMYMLEVLERDVRNDPDIALAEKVRDWISRGGCYADTGTDGRQVVVWKEDETICVAASTMTVEEMLERLGRKEDRGQEAGGRKQ